MIGVASGGGRLGQVRSRRLLASVMLSLVTACGGGSSDTLGVGTSGRVRVDARRVTGHIDRHLWGTQILWTGPSNGLPDKVTTARDASAARVKFQSYVPMIRELGPTVIRYPGGLLSNHYDWRQGIGPMEARPVDPASGRNIVLGTDEFGQLLEQVEAVGMITVNWALGPGVAADWVEYCNAPDDGSNPRGGTAWAAVRAANGHPAPYEVRYWEIGNELRGGEFFINLYATSLPAFRAEMKKVDPSIQIGAIGHGTFFEPEFARQWYGTIQELAPDGFDFWAKHLYAPSSLAPNSGFEMMGRGLTVEDAPSFPVSATYSFDLSIFNASDPGVVPAVELLVDGEVRRELVIDGTTSFTVQEPVGHGAHRIGLRLATEGIVRVYHEVPARAPFQTTVIVDFKNDRLLHDTIQAGFLTLETFLHEPSGTLGDHAIFATENNTVYNFQEARTRHVSMREALLLADLFHVLVRNDVPVATTFLLFEEDNGLGQIEGVSRDARTREVGRDDPRPRPTYWVQKLYRDFLDEGERLAVSVESPERAVGSRSGVTIGFVSSLLTRIDVLQAVAGLAPDGHRLTVMVINKDRDEALPVRIDLEGFTPRNGEHAFVTGPTAGSTNEPEDGPPSVLLTTVRLADVGATTRVTLPPHSVSAVVFHR